MNPRTIRLSNGTESTVYNGLFKVESVGSPTTFRYKLAAAPEEYPPNIDIAAVGWAHHATGASGGTGAVEEGNRVYGATFGSYNDTFSTKDIVIRNNCYHDVLQGVYYSMGERGPLTTFGSGQQLTYDSGTNIATFATPFAHGLLPRSAIETSGTLVGGSPNNSYNGIYEVLDVPSPTTFRYQMGASPTANADPNTGQYREFWRIRRLEIENNIVELQQYLTGTGSSLGVHLANNPDRPGFPYIFLQAVIRNNLIREVNDAPDQYAYGIRLWRCESAVVEQNVIDPGVGFPVNQYKSGTLEYFDNTTPAGALIQGYDTTAGKKLDELTTRVEDSLVLAML